MSSSSSRLRLARLVVGHAAGGRKPGRGRGGQEVERHLLPRHTPQNPTTHFPTFPHNFLTFPHIFRFEPNTNCVRARRGLGNGYCAVAVASQAILHPSACLKSYTILHNPSPICMSRNPTASSQSYISLQFPSNLPKFAERPLFI